MMMADRNYDNQTKEVAMEDSTLMMEVNAPWSSNDAATIHNSSKRDRASQEQEKGGAAETSSVEAEAGTEESNKRQRRLSETSSVTTQKNQINNEQWDTMYQRLVAFKEQNGHCLVPKRYAVDPKLYVPIERKQWECHIACLV